MHQELLPIGSIIELTQPVYNRAESYRKYFSSTGNMMPVGTLFLIIRYSIDKNKPYGVRLLVDGEEIVQSGGSQGCYHSLESHEYRLYQPSNFRNLLKHVRNSNDT